MPPLPIPDRLARLPWSEIERQLWEQGHARTSAVLTPDECRVLIGLYDDDGLFRSRPGHDYTGGEFVLVEQRPRAQSTAQVMVPAQGELVVFTTRYRPVAGQRGHYRAAVRHGVSRLRSGRRYTLGIIFHDAR